MKKTELKYGLGQYDKALQRFRDAVAEAETQLEVDGVIQRFEFTFELAWKTLKRFLYYQGIECYSPRNCLREAYSTGFINDDDLWLDMLDDRNLTSHIYDEEKIREIFKRIKENYLEALEVLRETFETNWRKVEEESQNMA